MTCRLLVTLILISAAFGAPEIALASPFFYTAVSNSVLRFDATTSHTADPAPGRSGASFAPNLRASSEDLLIGPDVTGDGVPDLYVAESNANQAGRYYGDNGAATTGTRFDSMPQNLDATLQLRGLAYYQSAVYMTRRGGTASSAITRYDFSTDVEAPFASNPAAGLNDPYDVLVDGSGNVFTTESAGHDIRKFSSTGALLAIYDLNGTEKSYMTLSPNGQDIYYGVRLDTPGIRRLHLADGSVSTVITSAALGSSEPRGLTFGPDLNSDGSPDLFVALNTTTGSGPGKIVRLNVNLATGAGTLIGDYLTNTNLGGNPVGLFYDSGAVPEPATIGLLSMLVTLMRRRAPR